MGQVLKKIKKGLTSVWKYAITLNERLRAYDRHDRQCYC